MATSLWSKQDRDNYHQSIDEAYEASNGSSASPNYVGWVSGKAETRTGVFFLLQVSRTLSYYDDVMWSMYVYVAPN